MRVLDLLVDLPEAVRRHWLPLAVDLQREVLVLEVILLVRLGQRTRARGSDGSRQRHVPDAVRQLLQSRSQSFVLAFVLLRRGERKKPKR